MPRKRQADINDFAALSSLDEPVRRRLYDFVAGQGRPVGRDEAASAVGIGRTLAAYHLDKLAEHQLLETSYERLRGRSGPGAGRPAKLYSRAQREHAASVPPRDYLVAGRLLVEAAERDVSGTTLTTLLQAARELGVGIGAGRSNRRPSASAAACRRTLTATLRERGYEPYESEDGGIRLRNCPFHELAQQNQAVVCTMNLALAEGLLAGLETKGLAATLEFEPGHCCVAIRQQKANEESGLPRSTARAGLRHSPR